MEKDAGLMSVVTNEKGRKLFLKINQNKEHQQHAGKMSKYWENKKAKVLEEKYGQLFQPAAVCDRIAIENGKIIFIEIKRKGQDLRPLQEKFKTICKELEYSYITEYI
jgi:uncharacterized transporter YbjL